MEGTIGQRREQPSDEGSVAGAWWCAPTPRRSRWEGAHVVANPIQGGPEAAELVGRDRVDQHGADDLDVAGEDAEELGLTRTGELDDRGSFVLMGRGPLDVSRLGQGRHLVGEPTAADHHTVGHVRHPEPVLRRTHQPAQDLELHIRQLRLRPEVLLEPEPKLARHLHQRDIRVDLLVNETITIGIHPNSVGPGDRSAMTCTADHSITLA